MAFAIRLDVHTEGLSNSVSDRSRSRRHTSMTTYQALGALGGGDDRAEYYYGPSGEDRSLLDKERSTEE